MLHAIFDHHKSTHIMGGWHEKKGIGRTGTHVSKHYLLAGPVQEWPNHVHTHTLKSRQCLQCAWSRSELQRGALRCWKSQCLGSFHQLLSDLVWREESRAH